MVIFEDSVNVLVLQLTGNNYQCRECCPARSSAVCLYGAAQMQECLRFAVVKSSSLISYNYG
jgi:hypothetical protein